MNFLAPPGAVPADQPKIVMYEHMFGPFRSLYNDRSLDIDAHYTRLEDAQCQEPCKHKVLYHFGILPAEQSQGLCMNRCCKGKLHEVNCRYRVQQEHECVACQIQRLAASHVGEWMEMHRQGHRVDNMETVIKQYRMWSWRREIARRERDRELASTPPDEDDALAAAMPGVGDGTSASSPSGTGALALAVPPPPAAPEVVVPNDAEGYFRAMTTEQTLRIEWNRQEALRRQSLRKGQGKAAVGPY